jgi:hypothetical protein
MKTTITIEFDPGFEPEIFLRDRRVRLKDGASVEVISSGLLKIYAHNSPRMDSLALARVKNETS